MRAADVEGLADALASMGLGAGASRAQVTAAYHRLARATHPDVCPDPQAGERFVTLGRAYRAALEALDRLDAHPAAQPVPTRVPARPGGAQLRAGPVRWTPWTPAPVDNRREQPWS